MYGATAWSCGRWCRMESDHTGTSPTEMWAQCCDHNWPSVQFHRTAVSSIFSCTCAGDQVCGRGLQAAGSYGLPRCSTHPHAGLLAEGSQREAALLPDSHRSWQANPQPREPEVYGHALQVGGPLNRSIFTVKQQGRIVSHAEESFDLIWRDSSPTFNQILVHVISGLGCKSKQDTSARGWEDDLPDNIWWQAVRLLSNRPGVGGRVNPISSSCYQTWAQWDKVAAWSFPQSSLADEASGRVRFPISSSLIDALCVK